jgi:hypothetical protein
MSFTCWSVFCTLRLKRTDWDFCSLVNYARERVLTAAGLEAKCLFGLLNVCVLALLLIWAGYYFEGVIGAIYLIKGERSLRGKSIFGFALRT